MTEQGTAQAGPLAALDAALLSGEYPGRGGHVGGLYVFEPPDDGEFDHPRFLQLVRSRLHLVPRYRQRPVLPPLSLGSPVWIDDPQFDLSYHVRHAALPRPGTTAQLTEYSARILSRPLDHDRPLWELYVIEGLAEGRFALLSKNHPAIIGGRTRVDLVTTLLDPEPGRPEAIPEPLPWDPSPPPTRARLAVDAVRDLASSPPALRDAAHRVSAAPAGAARRAVELVWAAASVATSGLSRPAPRSLLNQPPGPHRRFATQRLSLEEAKRVKNAFGTTVNDVVLAVVADATGRYLRSRGAWTDWQWLRVVLPVSTRGEPSEGDAHDRVAAAFLDLPVFEMDPVERLRVCHQSMRDVTAHHHAVGAGLLVGLSEFTPPTLHALAARAAATARLFNFLVVNVPGPQRPVHCLGARLSEAFPFAPLTATQSYAVGVISVGGGLDFGVTADYDALPDVERVTGLLADSLADLLRCADAAETMARRRRGADPGTDERADGD